uniref:ShKT domain-containing protein n=1 Tax=Strongyloides stercoralis TaxID=6248 RepID=A0A0K0DZA5_STRER
MFITLPLEVKSATCAQMAEDGYCNKSTYRNIMCSNCAKECNARGGIHSCELPVKSSACSDVATNCLIVFLLQICYRRSFDTEKI